MRIYALLVLLVISQSLFAQKYDEDEFLKYKEKYPNDQAIFLKQFEDVDIKIVGDSLQIITTNTEEILHLGSQSSVYAKDAIHSSSFYKTENIKAKTLIPDKRKYKILEVTDFKESYDKNSSVFYDDSKTIKFYFPGVQEGAITSLTYNQVIIDPKFLTSFLFQSYLPVAHSKYTIIADEGVELRLDILNDDKSLIKKKVEDLKGRKKYTFEAFDVPKLKFEDDAPPIRYSSTSVISLVKSFEVNGKKNNVLSSPEDLFAWYSTFIDGLKEYSHENVKAIVNEIIDDSDTELEKVRKVFYWVQNNIKYIAFEDGMRGLIPHTAEYVCTKRYGDCKDMATIVINMLHEAGVEAYFTWIGTRDIPYKYSEYPSPMVDNHMIATYKNGDRYYFLDATSQYSSFELPSAMIQGKEALIALDNETFEIKTVPVIDKEVNLRQDSISFQLENGSVKGSGLASLHGYPKVYNSYRMVKSSKQEVDDYLVNILQKGSNKFFIDDYTIKNLDDLDTPIEVKYQFRVQDYYREIGDKIYFNMNLDRSITNEIIDEDREQPREFNFKLTNKNTSVLNLPDGYKINRMPENAKFDSEVFGFNINYEVVDNKVILHRTYYINELLIMPEHFDQWNEAIKKLNDAYRAVLILEKTEA
ncbi:DUF3857 domain-containing protein [Fulvivirga lutea]|uniref:DUF3857 domain-containing protein n=1 Tax=Fulvivirga lutea TaxID=2810512 RepID=A0A974WIF1_9BACT|nr:DUF3857 domain-containing protein [Fulvivirga lutea]QSE98730.1 DUF3857 domain-containing protein [Fulvivirga lutea]